VDPESGPRIERSEFDAFFRLHYRGLIRYARYAGATPEEADEAVSDAMRQLHTRWTNVVDPQAWVRKATKSNFLKLKERDRDRYRRHHVPLDEAVDTAFEDHSFVVWENKEWVDALIEQLPREQAQTMRWVVDDFTPIEIAALLGCTSAAVRRRLCDARKSLRRLHQGQTMWPNRSICDDAQGETDEH
jgi:RNA polymerase sigma-70 factor (ECF subfamily)